MHIEGTFEPKMMLACAACNSLPLPFPSVEAAYAAYRFANLQDFLDLYYRGMGMLRTQQDFYNLTLACLRRAHADLVRHVEIFSDPSHSEWRIPFAAVIDGIHGVLAAGAAQLRLSFRLILSFLRHLSEEDVLTLADARPFLPLIAGVGLDSSEIGNPPGKFARGFACAQALGLRAVAHAWEEEPPAYVLETPRIDRIDPGNQALEDQILVERLVWSGVMLTVCSFSNLRLGGVDDPRWHPLPRMLALGLKATINSDDPAYFDGYLDENFCAVRAAQPLTIADAVTLATNSFTGSFLSDAEQQIWMEPIMMRA